MTQQAEDEAKGRILLEYEEAKQALAEGGRLPANGVPRLRKSDRSWLGVRLRFSF